MFFSSKYLDTSTRYNTKCVNKVLSLVSKNTGFTAHKYVQMNNTIWQIFHLVELIRYAIILDTYDKWHGMWHISTAICHMPRDMKSDKSVIGHNNSAYPCIPTVGASRSWGDNVFVHPYSNCDIKIEQMYSLFLPHKR